jgi:hypothetical protein
VLLCKHCLANTSAAGGRRPRPKPQARGPPRSSQRPSTTNEGSTTAPAGRATDQNNIRRTLPALPASDVLDLLRVPPRIQPAEVAYQLRFELVSAYAALQEQIDPNDADAEWLEVCRNGELARAIDSAFALGESLEPMHVQSLRTALEVSGLYV